MLDGRRGRAPDEYLGRRHPGLEGINRCTSTRVHSVRTHSAFDRGSIPTAALESLPVLRFRCLVLSFALSHRKTIESSGHASRPVQLHSCLNPYHQLTTTLERANSVRRLRASRYRRLLFHEISDDLRRPCLQGCPSASWPDFLDSQARLPSAPASTNSARCLTRDGELRR